MHLSDEDLAELQQLYKEHYGVDISKEEAHERGLGLLQLFKAVD